MMKFHLVGLSGFGFLPCELKTSPLALNEPKGRPLIKKNLLLRLNSF